MGCIQCGNCCRVLYLGNIRPTPEMLEYYEARKWSYNPSTKVLTVHDVCPHLVDGKCDIYETRPKYCKDFPLKTPNVIVPKGCAFEKLLRRRVR